MLLLEIKIEKARAKKKKKKRAEKANKKLAFSFVRVYLNIRSDEVTAKLIFLEQSTLIFIV